MKQNLLSLHGEFQGNPRTINGSSFEKPEYKDLEVFPNKCIENSYNFAIANNCVMVEGILIILIDNKPHAVEPHCWNKKDNIFYDTTIDYLTTISNYQNQIGDSKVDYIYYLCTEYYPQESGYQKGLSTFYYNYDLLINYIKSKIHNS